MKSCSLFFVKNEILWETVFFSTSGPREKNSLHGSYGTDCPQIFTGPPQGMLLHDALMSEHDERTACVVPFSMCARARPETENVVF